MPTARGLDLDPDSELEPTLARARARGWRSLYAPHRAHGQVLYLAAVQALAYQTRQVVEAMDGAGPPPILSVIACGGLSKNSLYVSTHADVLARPLHLPVQEEAVLLGAAS